MNHFAFDPKYMHVSLSHLAHTLSSLHSLTLSHTLSHTLTQSLAYTRPLILSLSHTLSHTLSHSLSQQGIGTGGAAGHQLSEEEQIVFVNRLD